MTQIGEGVAAGGGKDPNKPDLEENHWLELEYRYQNGAPIYGTYEAIDSEGMIWTGRLNDEGQVCLAGLPDGNVQVSLLPEENTDTELEETRKAIQTVLDQIIADQRAEAEEYERELEQMGGARRAFTHIHSFGKGLWSGAVGVIEFIGDTAYKVVQIADYLGPINQLGNVLKAGYQSYQSGDLTWDEWYDSVHENLQNEHKKDIARLLGVEPDELSEERLRQLMQMVAEAYDIAAFIADDQETQDMLKQFAEDMADAQHSVEWAEFAGAGVFELVLGALLAIFTGGAGNVAQATSKLRHAARLRNLGHLFRKLARLLRRKKLNKSVDASVDQRTTTDTDQPDAINLNARGTADSDESSSVWHATSNSRATQGVLNGIDPAYLNPNSRFGAAFYVAEEPGTTVAELAHHGVDATHGIRFELNTETMKVLDLTDSEVAGIWGYNGGPISSSTQSIGVKAQEEGFNVIRFYSERSSGGVNNAVLDDFNEILKPVIVTPVKP